MPIEFSDCDRTGPSCRYHTVIEQVAPERLPDEQRLTAIIKGQEPLDIPPEQKRNTEVLMAMESITSLMVPFSDIDKGIEYLPYSHNYIKDALEDYVHESGVFLTARGAQEMFLRTGSCTEHEIAANLERYDDSLPIKADYFDLMNGIVDFLKVEGVDDIQEIIDHLLGPGSKPYERVNDKFHGFKHWCKYEADEADYEMVEDGHHWGNNNFRGMAGYLRDVRSKNTHAVVLVHGAGKEIDFELVDNLGVPQDETDGSNFIPKDTRIPFKGRLDVVIPDE